eukprot:XP_011667778.1 PREDICTED: uncharacterized protein LOC105439913 [Strongylocentrotus purpuratus]
MVCHLWSECLLDSDTTTQTELLDSVNVFLAHHANTRSKSRVKITPDELREIISQLGKVALTGLLDDAKKLVFSHHDFRRAPAILDRACELGIVSKTTVSVTGLPQPNETTFNNIEFYHKLAQEHSAGKYLAAKTKKYMLRLKISKLDRLLQKIKANIGDYENLIRFAAGTDNKLCIRIMEVLHSNRFLDESERYRILLDCSSETSGTEGNVLSLVQRCVNAQSIVLKSPTVYTVVGMQNLPKQLKREVTTLKFEGSTLSIDVTSGLWSCLRSFTSLIQLSISDSSLSFPPSPPELPSITELSAERVTSQSYEGLLSSLPGLKRVDITIGDEKTENISQIQTSLRRHLTGQDLTRIDPHSFPLEGNVLSMSRQKMTGLGFLITECQATLSGVAFGLEGALIDVVQSSTRLMSSSLYFEQFSRTLKSDELALNIDTLKIKDCQLSTEMTDKLWSCLRSFTSLTQLSISDSSLSFHPSHPELLSVTKLSAERVTSQSFEGVLSSVPGVKDIDVSIGVAETSNTFQITTTSTSRPIGQTGITDEQSYVHIRLHAWPALTTDMNIDSGESIGGLISLLFRDQTKDQQRLHVSGMKGRDEEALVDLFVKTKQLTSLNSGSGFGSLSDTDAIQNTRLKIQQCQLSTEMTEKLWSYLRSFTSLNQLSISDSSLNGNVSSMPQKRIRGLGFLITECQAILSGVVFGPKETVIDLVQSSTRLMSASLYVEQFFWSLNSNQDALHIQMWNIKDCQLSTEMTIKLWSCLGAFISLNHLTISDSSLSFPPSPPELPFVTKLSAQRVTSQSYEGLFASLPGLRDIDITIDDAERDIPQITAGLRQTEGQQLTTIRLEAPSSLPSEKKRISRETVRGMGLLIREQTKNLRCFYLTGVKCLNEEELVELVESSTYLKASDSLHLQSLDGGCFEYDRQSGVQLPSVTKLSAERVTSQSYEGLLSSLPGLREIDITINEAERDIPQITTCLRRTTGQQLTTIRLKTQSSLPSEMNSVSRETVRGLGLLIREQIKNLRCFYLTGVKCLDEEDLVELVESSTYLKASDSLHLQSLDGGCFKYDRQSGVKVEKCRLSTEMTARMWSCLRSITSVNQLTISESSLSFSPSTPKLPLVTKLSAKIMTSESYEGLHSSLPGLRKINITMDDAERGISQITTCLRRTGGQQLTYIELTAPPSSLPSEKKSVSRETMRGLGFLIREQTKNLQGLHLSRVESLDEEGLVDLIEFCRRVETMSDMW